MCGTCADHYDKISMREHVKFASSFVIVYVVICICFKAESDFPDPNVERSMSLRYPAKGEFEYVFNIYRVLSSLSGPTASEFMYLDEL